MELKVQEFEKLQPIQMNYEEVKEQLTKGLEKYQNVVYTEETIAEAKNDRASLNKLSKAINDEKKRVKEELLQPYTDFEKKCKELMEMVDKTSGEIDKQIKAFEETEKSAKMQNILQYWIEHSGNLAEAVDVDKLIKDQWLNKTYTMKKITDEIDHIITNTALNFKVLENNSSNDKELEKRLKDFYLNNIDSPSVLSLTMQEKERITEANKKIENLTPQVETKLEEPVQTTTKEEIVQFDFRIWATPTEIKELGNYLKARNIKVGKVK